MIDMIEDLRFLVAIECGVDASYKVEYWNSSMDPDTRPKVTNNPTLCRVDHDSVAISIKDHNDIQNVKVIHVRIS